MFWSSMSWTAAQTDNMYLIICIFLISYLKFLLKSYAIFCEDFTECSLSSLLVLILPSYFLYVQYFKILFERIIIGYYWVWKYECLSSPTFKHTIESELSATGREKMPLIVKLGQKYNNLALNKCIWIYLWTTAILKVGRVICKQHPAILMNTLCLMFITALKLNL